ncbi:MAG: response regulator transcription factor [Rhodospirillaceae bacterium]|nr:response regulator transcription factor [Rhodospirillaceae bacterium]MBL6942426.1 response regulator transcription factor [Rhodospirillales bacterium]
MNTPEPVVYVIDDDDAVRKSLTWLISSVDLNVKAYASATAFLSDCEKVQTGCLITDIRMPGLSGLDLQIELERRGIDIPVVVISGHGDVQTAVRAMKAGAFDFIEKPFNDQLLLDLVHKAVSQSMSSSETHTQLAELQARENSLTPRELQVLELIAMGEPNKSIGHSLEISDKTVEAHRAKVMSKMKASSLAELVKMVLMLNGNEG